MTDTKIEPALTAEEWAEVLAENVGVAIPIEIRPRRSPMAPRWAWDAHGIVALCNHNLPDDDPRKLKAEHIAALAVASESVRRRLMHEGNDFWAEGERTREALAQLSAALQALLPSG